jgi:hypothetical protein
VFLCRQKKRNIFLPFCRFYKSSFWPKTFRIYLHLKILDKFAPINNTCKFTLGIINNTHANLDILEPYEVIISNLNSTKFGFIRKFRPKRFCKIGPRHLRINSTRRGSISTSVKKVCRIGCRSRNSSSRNFEKRSKNVRKGGSDTFRTPRTICCIRETLKRRRAGEDFINLHIGENFSNKSAKNRKNGEKNSKKMVK